MANREIIIQPEDTHCDPSYNHRRIMCQSSVAFTVTLASSYLACREMLYAEQLVDIEQMSNLDTRATDELIVLDKKEIIECEGYHSPLLIT